MSSAPSRRSLSVALLCLLAALPAQAQRPVDAVNPLIGTAPLLDKEYLGSNPAPGEELYSGTVNPGAMVPDPAGYVCLGPVTGFDGVYHVRGSGYRFDDATLMGFTHLNGEYSDVNKLLFMPTVGPIKTSPGSRDDPGQGYRSTKDSAREKAAAGYYSVFLGTYGVQVELTATANCGFHRYTFPRSEQANVLIDLANCRPKATGATVVVVDQRTVEGSQTGGRETVYFRAEFSKDFASAGTWKDHVVSPGSASAGGTGLGAYVTFHTADQETILVRVGTSTVSQADAAANLAREIPDPDFDATRRQTGDLWSAVLDRVTVEGGSPADRTNFYTGIYRMAAGPKYTWFPSDHSNGLIIARGSDWVAKRLADVRGSWGRGYWGPGNVSSLVALYKMGFHGFDLGRLYQRLHARATEGGGTAGRAYRRYGYIPAGSGVDDYVNRSIGLSYDDRAMAELAGIVGQTADRDFFLARAEGYKQLFNPSAGFFVPRRADGSWLLPCDPVEPHAEDVFREGNAWNYLWFNTNDLPGLIGLLGGPDRFAARLDTFFTADYNPKVPLRDLTGVVGLYFHGNEQYRKIPYLYNAAGQPWKTQALVRKIERVLYRPVPAGLCGMDDYGALEGWFMTSALGYCHVDGASEYYEIGSPLFPKATIALDGATPGSFTIQANHVSEANVYIQSATLNGKPLETPRFRQNDMVPGGSLVFEMGPEPNKQWGLGQPVP